MCISFSHDGPAEAANMFFLHCKQRRGGAVTKKEGGSASGVGNPNLRVSFFQI
jgi:hypothetical protein